MTIFFIKLNGLTLRYCALQFWNLAAARSRPACPRENFILYFLVSAFFRNWSILPCKHHYSGPALDHSFGWSFAPYRKTLPEEISRDKSSAGNQSWITASFPTHFANGRRPDRVWKNGRQPIPCCVHTSSKKSHRRARSAERLLRVIAAEWHS